jgi:hypothetical protein
MDRRFLIRDDGGVFEFGESVNGESSKWELYEADTTTIRSYYDLAVIAGEVDMWGNVCVRTTADLEFITFF